MAPQEIPSSMKACQINTVPTPSPEKLDPQDLLLRVAVASLCHTDFMVRDGVFGTELPCTGSHEGAGTVVAMGKDVSGWSIGDRCMVALKPHLCGHCPSCNGPEERKHYCPNAGKIPGVTGSGAFAEYVVADSRESSKIPSNVTFETAAPMACAGRTVFRAVAQARLEPGQWIGIVGSGGGLGHLGIQFARAAKLKVAAVDASDNGVAMSKEMGADAVFDARQGKDKVVEQVQKVTGSLGVDATINLSDADSAAALAAAITKMHSHVVQIAQPDEVKIPFAEFIFRDIRFEGSLVCGKKQTDEMLEVVAKHGVKVTTHPLKGIDSVPELVELSHAGKIRGKGIIIIDEEAVKKARDNGAKY